MVRPLDQALFSPRGQERMEHTDRMLWRKMQKKIIQNLGRYQVPADVKQAAGHFLCFDSFFDIYHENFEILWGKPQFVFDPKNAKWLFFQKMSRNPVVKQLKSNQRLRTAGGET